MSSPFTLPTHLQALMTLFSDRGESAYPVGGCVRDTLLGVPPHDWDIAVTTPPEVTQALCESVGLRVIPTGLKHGTVTVLLPLDGDFADRTDRCDPIECTTCRTEGGYSDGRHPDAVSFTGRIADDLSRRDFTVNAMALRRDGTGELAVLDLFGGQDDLRAGVIRCVGDPITRFSEDALRMLRAVRFAVKLDFAIEPATGEAIRALSPTLARISRERVSAELEKILCSPSPEQGIRLLAETELLPLVLPAGAPSPAAVGRLSELPRELAPRLASLLWSLPPEVREANITSLRLPTATGKVITAVCASAELSVEPMTLPATAETGVPSEAVRSLARTAREWRHRMGAPTAVALAVRRAQAADTAEREAIDALLAAVRASEDAGDPVTVAELAIGGRDLMALGHKPGREIQETLHRLLAAVLDAPERNTRACLSELATENG